MPTTVISPPASAVSFPYFDAIKDFGAVGDDSTDNRTAFKNAIAALAAAGGGELFVPPGIFQVHHDPAEPFCLDLIASNVTILGAKGLSWIRAEVCLPEATVVLRVDQQSHVTIGGLGFDGNWAASRAAPAALGRCPWAARSATSTTTRAPTRPSRPTTTRSATE